MSQQIWSRQYTNLNYVRIAFKIVGIKVRKMKTQKITFFYDQNIKTPIN